MLPSEALKKLVASLEDAFKLCFSLNELRRNSIADFASFLQLNPPNLIGCERHKKELTNDVVKFYSITRLYFLVKGKNMARESNGEKRNHLKRRRVL